MEDPGPPSTTISSASSSLNDATTVAAALRPAQSQGGTIQEAARPTESSTISNSGQAATARVTIPNLTAFTPSQPLRKRTRTNTPAEIANSRAEELTSTPRTMRIRDLFPGKGSEASLGDLIDKLLAVATASISLAGKTKAAKKVQVDIHSAADILVLAGAI